MYHRAARRDIEDRELIERVLGGDQGAYAELVRRHHARVHGLCLSLVGPAAAEDAAQEVFLKAYARLKDWRGDAAFSTWLYRVASNHCLDLLRKEGRRRSESLEALAEREGPRLERLFAESDSARSAEDADLVRRVLAELPEDYRVILTLREMEGLEYKELMAALDCSLDSVKAKLQRARRSFRDALRHILPPEDVSRPRKT
ncbi:MAG: sigma-70 family RNA polymerase sigma factor [Elusimicrobia bacterium]|nr:sigma-70 family RNA polymerase sigma factor [Elusimicrobiota bacterium]